MKVETSGPLLDASKSAVGSATAADWVVHVLHRAGGELCMHQRYFLLSTPNRCNNDDPRRLIEAMCPLVAPLGWGFGASLVWEIGDERDREDNCAMMTMYFGFAVLSLSSC